MNLWQTLVYSLRNPSRRASLPTLFREVLLISATLYIIGHAVAASDLWLHATSESLLAQRYTASQLENMTTYGAVFFDELCPDGSHRDMPSCMINVDGTSGKTFITSDTTPEQSAMAVTNSSTAYFSAITLHDWNDTGVLVPTKLPQGYSFITRTVGANFRCESLNRMCAPVANGSLDCANIGYPFLKFKDSIQISQVFPVMKNGTMVDFL